MHKLTRRHVLAAGLAAGALANTAWAAYPEKPIRWIVGYPPGGCDGLDCPPTGRAFLRPDRAADCCR